MTASADTGSDGRGGSGRYSAITLGGTSGGASVGSGEGDDAFAVAHADSNPAATRPHAAATTRKSMIAL